MKGKLGITLMVFGAVLVLGALSLFLYNQYEDSQAGKSVEELLPQLIQQIQERQNEPVREDETVILPNGSVVLPNGSIVPPSTSAPSDTTTLPPVGSDDPSPPPVTEPDPPVTEPPPVTTEPIVPEVIEMDELVVDGYAYIGYLSIPDLGLELPVMADWDYPRLKIAPCRYTGTVQGGDLVIMAHNYTKHFGKLSKLKPGNTVLFTDVNGVTTVYEVVTQDVLQPTAVDRVTSAEYDLVLFTCTYGGRTRVTVYCDRV